MRVFAATLAAVCMLMRGASISYRTEDSTVGRHQAHTRYV